MATKFSIMGVIGYPLSHSLSPDMHNAAYRALGIDAVYFSLEVTPEQLEDTIKAMKVMGFKGINVTIPYKERIIKYLDELAEDAKVLEAVNTVVNLGGKLIGYNTDVIGFRRSIEDKFVIKGKLAGIIGAGGGAKAVAWALYKMGIGKIYIFNRTYERAVELAKLINRQAGKPNLLEAFPLERLPGEIANLQILINATPLGMFPNISQVPIPVELLSPNLLVYDLIYNPPMTRLLKAAQKIGANFINGVDMLVYQGAAAFELWLTTEAPIEVMKQALLSQLEHNY